MVESRVQQLEVTMAKMETHLEHIVDKIDSMVESFKEVSKTINDNHEEVAILKSQISDVKKDVDALHEARRVEKEQFIAERTADRNKNMAIIGIATTALTITAQVLQHFLNI